METESLHGIVETRFGDNLEDTFLFLFSFGVWKRGCFEVIFHLAFCPPMHCHGRKI